MAEAAKDAGCAVTLLLGPVQASPPPPEEYTVTRFETAADLEAALEELWPTHDVLIMAAAVSDYRPARRPRDVEKLPRQAGGFSLDLEPTPDLVAQCAAISRRDQLIIGFALEEPARLQERAAEKLARKGLGAIVANPLATMDSGEIDATVIERSGETHRPGKMSKHAFARWLIEWVIEGRRGTE